MEAKEKAEWLISKLGKEGAKRQAIEELGNSDTAEDRQYWHKVLDEI